jgi:hypothetical protein
MMYFILLSRFQQRLTETLKQKIRDMSAGAGGAEGRDFLDSFEEVMREEVSDE